MDPGYRPYRHPAIASDSYCPTAPIPVFTLSRRRRPPHGSEASATRAPSFLALANPKDSTWQLRITMERYDYGIISCITSIALEQPTVSSEALVAELKETCLVSRAVAGHVSSEQSESSDRPTAADIRWRVRVRRDLWEDAHEFGIVELLIQITSYIPYIPYGRILFDADCPAMIHPESAVAREIRYHLKHVMTQIILDRWSILHPQHGLMPSSGRLKTRRLVDRFLSAHRYFSYRGGRR
ncbi:hypothetical protein CSAL01_10703 [Colletotrichum salicis]|uniref:Uncharacterized protein n=1 Tax=Colletotrichum salicis TaxID=1209931 RepID=A0A135V1H6_9PEZI|nr:hypothetical protein CSAL01_10703 [Colletotrichum salicis]